jgi:hypothetical protein
VVWLLPVIGNTLMIAGTMVLFWGLAADRARGRARCPRCWYDMSGASGLVCPECGRDAKRPTRLLRTRRHWRLAMLGLVLLLLGSARFAETWIRRGQWWNHIPTRALIYAIPWAKTANSRYIDEFQSRIIRHDYDSVLFFNGRQPLPRIAPMPENNRRLLRSRVLEALTRPAHPAREELFAILPDLLEQADSQNARPILLSGLADTNPMVQYCSAIASQRITIDDRKAFVDSALSIASGWRGAGYPGSAQQELLAEAATLMTLLDPKDPRIVPALMNLLTVPEGPKDYIVHRAVFWALARVGPDAKAALPAIRPAPDYEPWNGHDPLTRYAVLMIEGTWGGRRDVLLAMLRETPWLFRSFAAKELGKDPPDDASVSAVRTALADQMTWVRLDAAESLLAWNRHAAEALDLIYRELKSGNLDVAYRVVALAGPHKLDLEILESKVKTFYADPLCPRGNVDGLLRQIADIRSGKQR